MHLSLGSALVSKPLLSAGTYAYHNLDQCLLTYGWDAWQLNSSSSPQIIQVFQIEKKKEFLYAILISEIAQISSTNIIVRLWFPPNPFPFAIVTIFIKAAETALHGQLLLANIPGALSLHLNVIDFC